MTGIRGDDLDLGVDLAEEIDEEGRRVEPHLDADPQPAGGAGRDTRLRALGDQLAEPPNDVVDLAADGAEDPHPPVSQGGAQFRLLGGEGDELRRTLERDERPWLPAILSEEVAVVVVVEDDDGDEALLAHALLDSSDALVLDVHRDRPPRDLVCRIRSVLSSCAWSRVHGARASPRSGLDSMVIGVEEGEASPVRSTSTAPLCGMSPV